LGVSVTALPFELHPEIPLEGRSVNPARYGRFVEMAAEIGLPFDAPERVVNTRRALSVAEAVRAFSPDSFDPLDRSLFSAYWAEQQDIGSWDVLSALVSAAGADPEAVRSAVEDGRLDPVLRAYKQAAIEAEVTGTPAWLIDGRALIPGYQDPDLYRRIVQRLVDR
jgi:predicted DsbA family dithiol-disulfide isomerase